AQSSGEYPRAYRRCLSFRRSFGSLVRNGLPLLKSILPREAEEDVTVPGSVNALIAAYLDRSPASTSPFKTAAAETQRTRRNILENFRNAHGDLPLYRTVADRRLMLLTREHMQRILNSKAATPFAQRNFLNTLRAMFKWAMKEGRIPDDPTL